MEDPARIAHAGSYREEEEDKLTWSNKIRCWKKARGPPYRAYGHPELVTLQGTFGRSEAYHRSLILKGNGVPPHRPNGAEYTSIEYRSKGVSIGDVGIISGYDGTFEFRFNIFLQANDPIHSNYVPREHKPLEPPLDPSEVRITPNYFTPGTIITSQGVEMTKHSESPLDVSFTSDEKEGGILILPDGATRQDMISTDRLYEYVKRNAPHWYQAINGYGGVSHTNGSIILVTGCDKTRNYTTVGFPDCYSITSTKLDFRYTQKEDYTYPMLGSDHRKVDTCYYKPSEDLLDLDKSTETECVFIRGLRFSLSESSWWDDMRDTKIQIGGLPTYVLGTRTRLQSWLHGLLVKMQFRRDEIDMFYGRRWDARQLFHPAFIINQVLLCKHPKAEIAIIGDEVWLQFANSHSYCTWTEMIDLVTQVFDTHKILELNGIVTLVPNTQATGKGRPAEELNVPDIAERTPKKVIQWVRHYYIYDWIVRLRKHNKLN